MTQLLTRYLQHKLGFYKNSPLPSLGHKLSGFISVSALAVLVACPSVAVEPSSLGASPKNLTSASSGSSTLEEAYTLGAGDRIRLDIFRIPQYSGENEVLVDGSLNLPVVGKVAVEGMTLEQAAAAVAAQYSRILRRPIVTVSLLTPRPLQIGVAGEVSHPGAYVLNREGAQFPSLTQVLEAAGGVRQSADLRRVEVRRPQKTGGDQIINVDLWQFLQTGDRRYNLTLRDGDAVFIPTATNVSLAESPQLAAASFASQESIPINIAIVGEVFRPGPYTVTGNARTAEAGVPGGADMLGTAPTVTRAIQVAGGITSTADIRRIQIRRPTRTGTEQTFEVDLWALLQAGDLRQDVILQDGDVVSVPTAASISQVEASQIATASFSPNTIRVNVVGEVARPGTVEVTPNTPLNQALLAAGGFSRRAHKKSVELIRLNPNGSVSRQQVRIDFAQGLNDQNNPPLRNNDVIIVGRNGLASISDTLETATNPIARFFTLFSLPLNFLRLF